MADYHATARSSYFKVKDEAAFWEALPDGLEIVKRDGAVALLCLSEHGWPGEIYHEDTDEFTEIDVADIVAEHLAPGWVAVLIEVGAEKMRYLGGIALAINEHGDRAVVDLNNIYELASGLGEHVTPAEG
jgi:hypothetical protein